MRKDDDFDKQVDLDPSEYSYKGKREPAFGPAALPFVILFLLSFPVSAVMHLIIYGTWPYWLR